MGKERSTQCPGSSVHFPLTNAHTALTKKGGDTGYERFRGLRSVKVCKTVIGVPGDDKLEDRVRSKGTGFNLHLEKPVDTALIKYVHPRLPT